MAKYTNALFPDKINDLIDNEGNVNPLSDAASKEYVNTLMSGALKREIVEELPVTDIDTNTIYMILDTAEGQEGNIYKEYLYINNDWEIIGSTATSGVGITEIELADTMTGADIVAAMASAGAIGDYCSCFFIAKNAFTSGRFEVKRGDLFKVYKNLNYIYVYTQTGSVSSSMGLQSTQTIQQTTNKTKIFNVPYPNYNTGTSVLQGNSSSIYWKELPEEEKFYTFYLRGYDQRDNINNYNSPSEYENAMRTKDVIYIKFSAKLPKTVLEDTEARNFDKFEVFASSDYSNPGVLGIDSYNEYKQRWNEYSSENKGGFPFFNNGLVYDFQYAIQTGSSSGSSLLDFNSNQITWHRGVFLGFGNATDEQTYVENEVIIFLDENGQLQERAYKCEMLYWDEEYYDHYEGEQKNYADDMKLYQNALLWDFSATNLFVEPENSSESE